MKPNIFKVGILVAILGIPTFVILFLNGFGKNHFEVRTYFPLTDSSTGKILMQGKDTVFHTVPDFSFLNQDSLVFSRDEMKGKICVVSFIFTRCGTICPRMSAQMGRVNEMFADNDDVRLISYTVDPANDTPSQLKRYAQKFDAQSPKWTFLTGDKKALYRLGIDGYKIPVADASAYDQSIKNIDKMFIHSEKLILIDKNGHIRGYYNGTDKEEVEDRLMAEIKILRED